MEKAPIRVTLAELPAGVRSLAIVKGGKLFIQVNESLTMAQRLASVARTLRKAKVEPKQIESALIITGMTS